jgi:hypothetical protein
MAYKLDKYGDQVRDDLDAVEQKTIYPEATHHNDGIMTKEQVAQLEGYEQEIIDSSETLTAYEIMMICR